MAELRKGTRITGTDRVEVANELSKHYERGRSIRDLAATSGRSYGFVHRLLAESGVALRGRGGAARRSTNVT